MIFAVSTFSGSTVCLSRKNVPVSMIQVVPPTTRNLANSRYFSGRTRRTASVTDTESFY